MTKFHSSNGIGGRFAGVPASLTQGFIMIKSADVVIKAIDEGYRKEPKEKARDYIGASGIGTQCDAYGYKR